MLIIRPTAIYSLFLVAAVSGMSVAAQTGGGKTSLFVIDPNRPYVYLEFDHIGPGIPRDEGEPKTRVWLRLMNNCRVPIVVTENGTPDGSPKDERQIMYEVVPSIVMGFGVPEFGPRAEDSKTKRRSDEPTTADSDRIPRGYMGDVGSRESVYPGKEILFSVPVNHLGRRWHIEIPFAFDLPQGKCCREDNIGGEPEMVIAYTLWDLPPGSRAQIQQK